MMNNHEERLRFERFWVENFEPDTFDDVEYSEILNTYDSNYIVTDDLNRSWLAWQARAKAQAVPEGFVLVSKDTLNKALNPNDYDEAVCSANELLAVIEAQGQK